MNLLNLISDRDPQKPLFLLHDEQVNILQISELQQKYSGLLQEVAGKPIALCLRRMSLLAKCIILFDGVCSQITLMPREVNSDVTKDLIVRSGAQAVISDYLTSEEYPVKLLSFTESSGPLPAYEYETKWLLPTSGTTGTPKLMPHTIVGMSRTVKPNNAKGAFLCWGTLYDIGRFAGLQVYLQALIGGSSLALLDDPDVPLAEILSFYKIVGVNALSATPTMWQKILMTSQADKLALKQITLGGEIARQRVLDALVARYPDARIIHIYASTEFGVGFSVTDRMEGFPAEWIYGTKPIGKIDPETGELFFCKGDDWFPTGDAVYEIGKRIFFSGRLNGSINVGGNKVMPEEVERVLLQYPGVKIALVSAQKSSFMGNLVQAQIVASMDCPVDEFRKKLIAHCNNLLAPYKVPAFIKFVDDISLSSAGKIKRNMEVA